MKKYTWNPKAIVQVVFVIGCIITLAIFVIIQEKRQVQSADLSNVNFASKNNQIDVNWDLPAGSKAHEVVVDVTSEGQSYRVSLSPQYRSYKVTNGIHGTSYTISLQAIREDGSLGSQYQETLLFLNYDKLPKLPTVYIDTVSGEDPKWTVAKKPNSILWGASLDNNKPVAANMKFTQPEGNPVSIKTSVKVRGNTSSVGGHKQSYKLKLDQAVDLLGQGPAYAEKEWLLLNAGTSLNNYVGEYLAELCGMEWVTRGRLVNVMVNQDWKGIYYLSEPVSQKSSHGEVSKSGYVIENDAYWWKKGTIYFKTSHQIYQLGYTFKYPDIKSKNDERLMDMRIYMNTVTDMITERKPSVQEYIDFDTFASWVMVRDIMQTGDGGGSNMYYYLNTFDRHDYASNKLKMGPVWDFDAGMKASEYWHHGAQEWSTQHTSKFILFPYLFDLPEFRKVYAQKWAGVSSRLRRDFSLKLDDFYEKEGEAIEESRKLDAARWGREVTPLKSEIDYDKDFVNKRIDWIDEAVKDW